VFARFFHCQSDWLTRQGELTMSASPKDFFIGITEFFSLLLPGALFVGLFTEEAQAIASVLGLPTDGFGAAVGFAVASYIAGHVLHAAGSLLDRAYDRWYSRPRRSREGQPSLYTLALRLHHKMLGADMESVGVFSWSGSFVRVASPGAASEIEARSSESKFFRSLIPVLTAALIVIGWRIKHLGFVTATSGALVIDLLLIVFAWRRYCLRRWDSVQLTYEYFVLLNTLDGYTTRLRVGAHANEHEQG
jgi:hypothetical protein